VAAVIHHSFGLPENLYRQPRLTPVRDS
jgi:hypothetical protein